MEFLFGQTGWKSFIEDIELRMKQEKDDAITRRPNQNDLQVAHGRSLVYEYILSLEPTLAEVKRQLASEQGAEIE
jgi:hypothetical protein